MWKNLKLLYRLHQERNRTFFERWKRICNIRIYIYIHSLYQTIHRSNLLVEPYNFLKCKDHYYQRVLKRGWLVNCKKVRSWTPWQPGNQLPNSWKVAFWFRIDPSIFILGQQRISRTAYRLFLGCPQSENFHPTHHHSPNILAHQHPQVVPVTPILCSFWSTTPWPEYQWRVGLLPTAQ